MAFKGSMLKNRKKYGSGLNRPQGHGGSRGNGVHLKTELQSSTEKGSRVESKIINEQRRESQS